MSEIGTPIFTSSIWFTGSVATRLVWFTLIGSCEDGGLLPFSGIENIARRARVSLEEASEAMRIMEAPDPYSEFKTFEGRRVERTERDGWRLLNHEFYTVDPRPWSRRPYIRTAIRRVVYERDGYVCVFCGSPDRISLDHIVLYSMGGEDTVENLRVLCMPCNLKRPRK